MHKAAKFYVLQSGPQLLHQLEAISLSLHMPTNEQTGLEAPVPCHALKKANNLCQTCMLIASLPVD